ncbi:putative high-affinity glucose transporter of the major facilitator superfamily [Kockovaella imperatae]|uniref:Putative high-affinity glucose transporter of the major facilitator superfamily n=1 Tax=Kockovaella imperatae TaxID=4999 RepID=A0A1Y1UA76_9TREE|nr:putative high-affinity glucose transporter of the major facilitator superfamily [Kockovaella imperatae]ORX34929.1 putative high-affinity glucose transporter of the major facilitator superfamily [Kockovaella imperatae]
MGGGAVAGGDFEAVLAEKQNLGWRGLFKNGKIIAITCFASLGGVLYGYNQGVFSQVQVMYSFEHRYADTFLKGSEHSVTRGLVTSILELGAFFGSLIAGPLADSFSRKYSIAGWCIVFMTGTAVQAGANYSIACIYAGRFVGGLGVGALSMLVPMFNAELAPPGIRGSLVALQQLAITFGILVSYWIAYGTNYIGGTGAGQSSTAWRLPLSLQLIPAFILAVGICFLPFSPRWLMLRGREEECLSTLAYLRNHPEDHVEVQYEFRALQAERLVEREAAKERYSTDDTNWRTSLKDYKRLFTTKPLLHRLMLGASAQGLQQWTGINAIIYYAPIIFQQVGLEGNTISLLATGVVGIVNFVFTLPAVLFVDNFGRKPMLALGEANMAIAHATVGAIIAVYGGDFPNHKSAGNGAVFMIYWFIVWFAMTWGPLAWVVSAEVFPLDMRAKGMSVSSAVNWIMNFTVAMTTPVMIDNIGYKTYMVFMTFCIVGFIYSVVILPELRGLSLEEVDRIFNDQSGAEDRARRERVAKQIGLDKVAQNVQHKEGTNTVGDAEKGNRPVRSRLREEPESPTSTVI